jgi:tetratricopeptide (TPR) repeat protein
MLGWFQGADHAEMRIPLRRSVEIYRQICNKQGLALSLRFLAACFLDDPETARPLTEESVALCREVLASHSEDREAVWNLAEALFSNGRSALTQRDYEAAISNCTESVRLFKKTGDRWRAAAPILILGRVAYAKGEYATARGHFEESLALLQEAGDRFYSALLLDALALAARAEGDHEESARLTEESLLIWREIGNTSKQAEALHVLGISS